MHSHISTLRIQQTDRTQIVAAGLKTPNSQQNPNNADTTNTQKHNVTSSPQDGTNFVSPSNGTNASAFTPTQKKLIPLAPKDAKDTGVVGARSVEVHIQSVDAAPPPARTPRALDGMLMPASDEGGTQVSSSSGSGKPASADGKSVTSGTTFALDEKESLRPDDSASVKATEDEDVFSPPGSGLPGSRTGSDDGVRAFRDQLREISSMDPTRQGGSSQDFSRTANLPQGILYVPPQGSGVGTVPTRTLPSTNQVPDTSPDPKLLEALDSPKDRIMVLKLEQDIVDFVKDAKESSLKLPQTNAFYRMLAHKLADYYMLGHIIDESTTAVRIYKTPSCRLPPPLTGIATPSTAASTPPPSGPQMKILRRGMENAGPSIVNGSGTPFNTLSENGEGGNDDDRRPQLPASREEREARYEAARKRIMGSAKPSEYAEDPVLIDGSRSSSAAGKRTNRRKQRVDSDDDFEARSAYSAYYPTPYSSGGPTPPSYGFQNIVDSQSSQTSPASFGHQDTVGNFQQYGVSANTHWPNHVFQNGTSNWLHGNQPGYDLSGEFQRMTFQSSAMGLPSPSIQQGCHPAYGQQFNGAQQVWPQQTSYLPSFPSQPGPNYSQGYPNHLPSSSSRFHDAQAYKFGQLPSQAYPGRSPSTLEHPLPGSYKSKHFNPQSQTFIPAQPSGPNMMHVTPHTTAIGNSAYLGGHGMSGPLHRQLSGTSQNAAFALSQLPAPAAGPPRAPSQTMTHPLPQPVFPRQPSPNVPLPPKPEATPIRSAEMNVNGNAGASSSQGQSSIAKWGTPASLPAKPPPSAEPFDAAKFAQAQRQPSGGPTRMTNVIPSFGSMPPMNGGHGISGQSMQSPRRV